MGSKQHGEFHLKPKWTPIYSTNRFSNHRTLDSELYKTARISPSSLRYYGLGLKNGKYRIDLHFAEITMEDSLSWKGLGRRVFDVYIQVYMIKKNDWSIFFFLLAFLVVS